MSKDIFHDAVSRMPNLYTDLLACELLPMKGLRVWAKLHAVYVFYDGDGMPCHTGRTRNLQGRVRAHTANSHNSASFAFKRTRQVLGISPTYRKGEGRAALLQQPDFKEEFDRQRELIRSMKLRFVEVNDPVDQYLLELYTALRLETSLSEFTTS